MALGDKNKEHEGKKEEEATHFCLMGLENENEEEKEEVSDSCSYNDLYNAFESLLEEYKKLGLKNLNLKKEMSVLESDLKITQSENDDLKTRLDIFKEGNKKFEK